MKIQKINLGNHNELIIRSQKESFSGKSRKKFYYKSIDEILLKTDRQLLCIGICFSDQYTGQEEFIQYTPQCILFFQGNSIIKSYYIKRVFDFSTMQSLSLTKDEILEKYNISLPDEIKNSVAPKKYLKSKC